MLASPCGGEDLRPMQGMGRREDHRREREISERLVERRHELEAMLRGEFARGVRGGVHADDEAPLVRFALSRLPEAGAPAAPADRRGVDRAGWIPAWRIALVHLAISCLMKAANSSGGIGAGSRPSPASRALTSGLARLAATTSCTLVTTALGVPAGATRPYQMRVS